MNLAQSIPVAFPHFRSVFANEAFLFALTMVIFVVMYVSIALLFSLPGMGSNASVIENIKGTFKDSKSLMLFSLFVLVYLRAAYFILSKFKHESHAASVGFVLMMSITLIAMEMPWIKAWLDGSPAQYSAPAALILAGGVVIAYVLIQQLLRQLHEAKNKTTARDN